MVGNEMSRVATSKQPSGYRLLADCAVVLNASAVALLKLGIVWQLQQLAAIACCAASPVTSCSLTLIVTCLLLSHQTQPTCGDTNLDTADSQRFGGCSPSTTLLYNPKAENNTAISTESCCLVSNGSSWRAMTAAGIAAEEPLVAAEANHERSPASAVECSSLHAGASGSATLMTLLNKLSCVYVHCLLSV